MAEETSTEASPRTSAPEGPGSKIHGNENAKKAGEKPAAGGGNWIEKHKAIAYGGMGLILVILYIFLRSGSSGSASTTAATGTAADQSGVDPATGYLYGSPADLAALGGGSSTSATVPSGSAGDTTTNNYYSTPAATTTGTTTSTGTSAAKAQSDIIGSGKSLGGGKVTFSQSLSSLASKLMVTFTPQGGGAATTRYIPASATSATFANTGRGGTVSVTPLGANGQAVGSAGQIYVAGSSPVAHAKG